MTASADWRPIAELLQPLGLHNKRAQILVRFSGKGPYRIVILSFLKPVTGKSLYKDPMFIKSTLYVHSNNKSMFFWNNSGLLQTLHNDYVPIIYLSLFIFSLQSQKGISYDRRWFIWGFLWLRLFRVSCPYVITRHNNDDSNRSCLLLTLRVRYIMTTDL